MVASELNLRNIVARMNLILNQFLNESLVPY